ncbi:MAG: class 1 fructose-bisphosphatase [Acidobacteria bacterium]|nr:MAG: class 1 fructose-bisphosphatase [Acidobacteriota bacterium]
MSFRSLTLQDHIKEGQKEYPHATGEFSGLMSSLVSAAKVIACEVNKAALAGLLGLTGQKNVQGEKVQKLDAFTDDILRSTLERSGHVCVMLSEECSEIVPVSHPHHAGNYAVVFDPLDGSSNIDANVGIGTIFGIYRRVSPAGGPGVLEDVLQSGHQQIAAGYVLYGPSTMFVYSAGKGVSGFTLDPAADEFLCSHPTIRTPARGRVYSVNEGNTHYWTPGVRSYVERLKSTENAWGKPYSARYVGSLVADFHRNLLYGGIFLYPADNKEPDQPNGKLRLLYEASPLAFVAEQAGGAASDGRVRILDLAPTDPHQRVPLYLGSREDVAEAVEQLRDELNPAG